MNYTKGKWSVSYNGERDELGRYSVTTDTGRVATIQPHKDESESQSNARLIASAPVMYEALKLAQLGKGDWRGIIDLALAQVEVSK